MIVYLPSDDPFAGFSWGPVSPMLQLTATMLRGSVQGGTLSAEVVVDGPATALWDCLNWLRRPIEISSPEGQLVAWGFVNEVRLALGGVTVGVSLDPVANRVAVAYSSSGADGAYERGTTAWAENAVSVARYGYKEALISGGDLNVAGAEAKRATLLATRATPRGVPSFDAAAGPAQATLLCAGWFETLAWRRFSRYEGRIEFTDSSSATQSIGWGLTSNQIGFAFGAIHSIAAKLKALETGDKVIVTGSASNNTTYTVDGGTSADQEVYVASTISFAPSDDILDSANGLGFIEMESFIRVQGSAANSGYHLVDETGSNHVATTFTPTITAEAAGPSITLTQGHKVTLLTAVTNEAPGASVTLKIQGVQIAQSFVATHAFTVAQIGVQVGRVGNPVDNFLLELWSNSAGVPGTRLESVAVTGSTLTADSQPWRWVTFGNTVSLTLGTTYWIMAVRSGSNDPDNYYTLGMTETVSGSCLAYTGSGWVAHPRALYLPYKVWGAEDNATQMARMVSDCGQFLVGTDVVATGIATNQWRDGDMSALDELVKLLEQGDSSGRRLLAEVTPSRMVRIFAEPAADLLGARLLADGQIRNMGGSRRLSGLLPVGEWLTLDGVPPALNAALEISPLFVDEAGWRSSDPDKFEIVPKAAIVE